MLRSTRGASDRSRGRTGSRHRRGRMSVLVGLALAAGLLAAASPVAAAVPSGRGPSSAPLAAATTTKLTFDFAPGWTTKQETAITDFIAIAYPIMVDVYGPPAASFPVTIVPDTTLDGWAYFPNSWRQVGNERVVIKAEVKVNPADVADSTGRLHFLTHEILHGFHAPFALDASADEEGMTEAASRIVAARVVPLLGLDGYVADPSALTFNGRSISALVDSDALNDPVLAAPSFFNSDKSPRPQVNEMYAAAAAYWMTLVVQRPRFLPDFNAAWYQSPARLTSGSEQAGAVQALAAELVPSVGRIDYATWRGEQQVAGNGHPAGIHLLCTDIAPQLARTSAFAGSPTVLLDADLVLTDASGDDRAYEGPVKVSIKGPGGTIVGKASGVVSGGSLYRFGTSPVSKPGAYRFLVTASGAGGTAATEGCWAIAGVRSAGRLLVVGTPGTSVTATFSTRDASGTVTSVTQTQQVAADGIAIFEGAGPGLAEVGPAGAPPTKLVPVAIGGAIVALITADTLAAAAIR